MFTEPTVDSPFPDLHPTQPLPIIIRATNGIAKENRKSSERVRLSTVVMPESVEGFYIKYAEICKAGMAGLKKRDRSKNKQKLKAKKKKGAAEEGRKA